MEWAATETPRACLPRWLAYFLIFGLFLTLRGYHSRDSDQAYRLPLLLHRQNPALYADDPFVRAFDAFNPHRGYLALLDVASRPLGLSAGMAGLFALTFALTCFGLDRLARAVWPEAGPRVGLLAVTLVLIAKAGNIGTNHLFEAMLLDRLVAFALGWIAVALAVEEPECGWWTAPAALGAAALVHPSLGLQLALLMGTTWVGWALCPSWSGVRGGVALRGLAALAVGMAPGLAMNLGQGGNLFQGLPAEEFRLLSVELQGPQHMLPHLWRRPQWLAAGCYVVLGGLALAHAGSLASRRRANRRDEPATVGGPSAARARLAILMAINLAGIGLAWIAVEGWQDLRATLFQPFRMATVFRGLALVAVSGRVLALWRRGTLADRGRALLLTVGLAGDWTLVVATLVELSAELEQFSLRGSSSERPGQTSSHRVRCADQAFPQGMVLTADPTKRNAVSKNAPMGDFSPDATDTRSHAPRGNAVFDALRRSICAGRRPILRGTAERPGRHSHGGPWGRREHGFHPKRGFAIGRLRIGKVVVGTVLVLGLVFLSRHDTESGHVPMVLALVVLAVSSRLLRGREFRWNRRRLAWAILGAWAVPAAALLAASGSTRDQAWAKSLIERCRFAAIPADDVERLAVWCRDHTPASARFIGPPGPKTFRLWSLRSVAFNRAASPYHAAGLADWSSRFRDHVGFDGSSSAFVRAYLADRHGLERRYQSMSDSARAALAERQGATHVVAAAPEREVRDRADSPLQLLHVEGRYAVYRVRPPEEVAFHGTMSWERSRQDFGLVQFRGFLGNRYGSPWPWDFPREVEAPAETTVNGDARSNSAGASFSRSRTKPGIEPGLDFPFSDFFSRW